MLSTKLVIVSVLLALGSILLTGVHYVDEGYVGMYWRGGALLKSTTNPGFHVLVPLVTRFEQVQITMQTDHVINVPCGTSGGVMLTFDRIEVVNRLNQSFALETVRKYSVHYDRIWIFDKIHHVMNQFCSSHSLQEVYITQFDSLDEILVTALQEDCTKYQTGIEIIAVRVTKPRIPESVMRNYEQGIYFSVCITGLIMNS
jgi:regulator of protease activity HflC (stomatin/prohibitin superfamily)